MFDIKKTNIPKHTGIYLMKDDKGAIIYIGKAKNLRNRVKSYFLKNQNYKTQKLVQQIQDIEFILTDNESEAFLLESNLIKRHRPRFNIELKDQQRYTYLRLTDEKYPRLVVARRTRMGEFLGKGKIFGPFTQGSSKLLTIGSLRKTFQIRICKRLPKKACLEYDLGNCEAPCEFVKAQNNYSKNVTKLEAVLKGKKQMLQLTKQLHSQMKSASELQQYERAAEIRDTLNRLNSLQTKQKMEYVKNQDEEYFGIKIQNQKAVIMTFRQIRGVIRDSDKFSFDLVGDNTFSNFLNQYYTTHPIPKNIIVNELPKNIKILEKIFSKKAGFQVQINIPKGSKRIAMIELILRNIEMLINQDIEPGLIELQKLLNLNAIPKIIECFDISNQGIDYAVGAMSRFVNGKPEKSGYRKFKIKTIKGRDDYGMMSEIIKRRYFRLIEEKLQMPNLILIDGGKGHLNAVSNSLESLRLNIPCASLAKKNEEIFVPKRKKPIIIEKNTPALMIAQYARDEAHRFGIEYNRNLRKLSHLKN